MAEISSKDKKSPEIFRVWFIPIDKKDRKNFQFSSFNIRAKTSEEAIEECHKAVGKVKLKILGVSAWHGDTTDFKDKCFL